MIAIKTTMQAWAGGPPRALIMGLLSLVGGALAAQPSEELKPVLRELAERERTSPSLHDIFGDVASLVRSADASRIGVLSQRLESVNRELLTLSRLQGQLQSGMRVSLPLEMFVAKAPDTTQATLAKERQEVQRLKRELDYEVGRREARALARAPRRRVPAPVARSTSSLAEASLAVELDLPPPPATALTPPKTSEGTIDHAGMARALFARGDYSGTLYSYEQLPKDSLTVEMRYRMARAHDLLGRFKTAAPIYRDVAAADPEGALGKQAQWMLDWGTQRSRVREAIKGDQGTGGGK